MTRLSNTLILLAFGMASGLGCSRGSNDKPAATRATTQTTPGARMGIDSTGTGEESGTVGAPGTTRGTMTGTSGTSGTGVEPDLQPVSGSDLDELDRKTTKPVDTGTGVIDTNPPTPRPTPAPAPAPGPPPPTPR